MITVRAYFEEKIELALDFYEARLIRIDKDYLAGVERLAKRTKDLVLADFFRDTMKPTRISAALINIRFHLSQGALVEADMALERLKREIDSVEAHLRSPVLNAGLGTSRGGAKGALAKHGDPKYREVRQGDMRKAFDAQLKVVKSKTKAERLVARAFAVSPRTVRAARTGK